MPPSHSEVSRIAGPSERAISSFMRLRGTSLRNQVASAKPASRAASDPSPSNR
jgi:hypothetical protein